MDIGTIEAAPRASEQAASRVTFEPAGIEVAWSDAAGSLLELAEAAGLYPAFSCRAGICNTCMCDLVAGEVTYAEEPLDPPEPGKLLLCCSRPVGPVTVRF